MDTNPNRHGQKQCLLIGGEGHGQKVWAEGDRFVYPCKVPWSPNAVAPSQLYEMAVYRYGSQKFCIGLHQATADQKAQIPRLIQSTGLLDVCY